MAREETYAQAVSMGQNLLEHDIPNAKEVRNSHFSETTILQTVKQFIKLT